MAKEDEKPKKKKGLDFTIGPEDSALIVRTDGNIELVSRELQDNEDEGDYLGDLEDLNKKPFLNSRQDQNVHIHDYIADHNNNLEKGHNSLYKCNLLYQLVFDSDQKMVSLKILE